MWLCCDRRGEEGDAAAPSSAQAEGITELQGYTIGIASDLAACRERKKESSILAAGGKREIGTMEAEGRDCRNPRDRDVHPDRRGGYMVTTGNSSA